MSARRKRLKEEEREEERGKRKEDRGKRTEERRQRKNGKVQRACPVFREGTDEVPGCSGIATLAYWTGHIGRASS